MTAPTVHKNHVADRNKTRTNPKKGLMRNRCTECGGSPKKSVIAQEFENEGVVIRISGIQAWVCAKCAKFTLSPVAPNEWPKQCGHYLRWHVQKNNIREQSSLISAKFFSAMRHLTQLPWRTHAQSQFERRLRSHGDQPVAGSIDGDVYTRHCGRGKSAGGTGRRRCARGRRSCGRRGDRGQCGDGGCGTDDDRHRGRSVRT